jgi:hypothetical protein
MISPPRNLQYQKLEGQMTDYEHETKYTISAIEQLKAVTVAGGDVKKCRDEAGSLFRVWAVRNGRYILPEDQRRLISLLVEFDQDKKPPPAPKRRPQLRIVKK